jgi:hypothetical protein
MSVQKRQHCWSEHDVLERCRTEYGKHRRAGSAALLLAPDASMLP